MRCTGRRHASPPGSTTSRPRSSGAGRATYALHDRVLANRWSRRRFAGAPPGARRRPAAHRRPSSTPTATRSCRSPTSSRTTTRGRRSRRRATRSSPRPRRPRRRPRGLRVRAGKEFVVRLTATASSSDSTTRGSARARPADARLANTYLGCGRSSSTSTSGTRCRSPRRPSASRRSAGIATSTTSTC